MTEILVKFYNVIVQRSYYLGQWTKVLDVILEKGKGPVLGKLHTIQLIEVDFQILMRIFIGNRNKGNIERDSRVLKYNF